jgi:hypothetical protein
MRLARGSRRDGCQSGARDLLAQEQALRLDASNDLLRQDKCATTSASRQEKAPDDAGAFA